jgi:hypothetical protein
MPACRGDPSLGYGSGITLRDIWISNVHSASFTDQPCLKNGGGDWPALVWARNDGKPMQGGTGVMTDMGKA